MKPDPADVFGGAADDAEGDYEEPTPDEGDDAVPPEFESAYDEYADNPTAATAYRMIEACKGGGSDGLALLIGKGKPKKN